MRRKTMLVDLKIIDLEKIRKQEDKKKEKEKQEAQKRMSERWRIALGLSAPEDHQRPLPPTATNPDRQPNQQQQRSQNQNTESIIKPKNQMSIQPAAQPQSQSAQPASVFSSIAVSKPSAPSVPSSFGSLSSVPLNDAASPPQTQAGLVGPLSIESQKSGQSSVQQNPQALPSFGLFSIPNQQQPAQPPAQTQPQPQAIPGSQPKPPPQLSLFPQLGRPSPSPAAQSLAPAAAPASQSAQQAPQQPAQPGQQSSAPLLAPVISAQPSTQPLMPQLGSSMTRQLSLQPSLPQQQVQQAPAAVPSPEPQNQDLVRLSRRSFSQYSDNKIIQKNEDYINTELILHVVLESDSQPQLLQLSSRQIRRIMNNYLFYCPNRTLEEEYNKIKDTQIVLGIQNFDFGARYADLSLIYRQVFISIIEVSRQEFMSNSMAMLELLKQYLHLNKNLYLPSGLPNVFLLQSFQVSILGGSVQLNTNGPAFLEVVSALGKALTLQKRNLLAVMKKMEVRSDMVSLFGHWLPRTVSSAMEALKILLQTRQNLLQHESKPNQNAKQSEHIRQDLELVISTIATLARITNTNFSDDQVIEFLRRAVELVVLLPKNKLPIILTCIELMRLPSIVNVLRGRQTQMREIHFNRKKELLEIVSKSQIATINAMAYPISILLKKRMDLLLNRQIIPDVDGAEYQSWFELWLLHRQLNLPIELQQAVNLFNKIYQYNADFFWEFYRTDYLTNTKAFIKKLYTHGYYQGVLNVLSTLLGSNVEPKYGQKVSAKIYVSQLRAELNNLCSDKTSNVQLRLHEAYEEDKTKLAPTYIGFIAKIIAMSPQYLLILEEAFKVDLTFLLIQTLIDCGKIPKLSRAIFCAFNSILRSQKVLPKLLNAIEKTNDTGLRNHPAFNFATLTSEKTTMQNDEDYPSFLSQMTQHMELYLSLLIGGKIKVGEEESSNWASTIIRFLATDDNRKVSIEDISVCLQLINKIQQISPNLARQVRASLDFAAQQRIFNNITNVANTNTAPSNRYINSLIMTFVSQNTKQECVLNLNASLKILEKGLLILEARESEQASKQKSGQFKDMIVSLNKLSMNDQMISSRSFQFQTKLMDLIKSQFTIENVPLKGSAKPNFLLVLFNLITVNKSYVVMVASLKFEDTTLLALRVLNKMLAYQNGVGTTSTLNKLNKVLTSSEYTAGNLLTQPISGNTLKDDFIQYIGQYLIEQSHKCLTEIVDCLILLSKNQPILLKAICTQLSRKMEVMFLRSVQSTFSPALLYHTTMLLVCIQTDKDLYRIFARLFKMQCFLNALIKKSVSVLRFFGSTRGHKAGIGLSILTNMLTVVQTQLLDENSEHIKRVVGENIKELISCDIVNFIFYNTIKKSQTDSELHPRASINKQPHYINWVSNQYLLNMNLKQISQLPQNVQQFSGFYESLNRSNAYSQWFKLYLTLIDPVEFSQAFEPVLRKIRQNEQSILSCMLMVRDLVCREKYGEVLIEDKEPVYIALALTVQFFRNPMLSENICASFKKIFKSDIQSTGARFLIEAVAQLASSNEKQQIIDSLTDLNMFKNPQNQYEFLLVNLNRDNAKYYTHALDLLKSTSSLPCFVSCCRYLASYISTDRQNQQQTINTLSFLLPQYKDTPVYLDNRRAVSHIKWCWLVLLCRELFEVPTMAVIYPIHSILMERLKKIMDCYSTSMTAFTDQIITSIGLRQELYLIVSFLLSIASQYKLMASDSVLAVNLCSVITKLIQTPAKPHSQFEAYAIDKYPIESLQRNQTTNVLQLTSDVLLITIFNDVALFSNQFLSDSGYLYQLSFENVQFFQDNLLNLHKRMTLMQTLLLRNRTSLNNNMLSYNRSLTSLAYCRQTSYLNTIFPQLTGDQLINMAAQTLQNTWRLMEVHLHNLAVVKHQGLVTAFANGMIQNAQSLNVNLPMLLNKETLELIIKEIMPTVDGRRMTI